MSEPDSTWKPAPPTPEERARAERSLARIIRDDERSGLNIDHTYWYGEPAPKHLTLPEMMVVDELHAAGPLFEYVLFMRTRHHFWSRHATLCALAKGYWLGRKTGERARPYQAVGDVRFHAGVAAETCVLRMTDTGKLVGRERPDTVRARP